MRYSGLLFGHYVTGNRKKLLDQVPLFHRYHYFRCFTRSSFTITPQPLFSLFFRKKYYRALSFDTLMFLSLDFIYRSICFSNETQVIQHNQNLSWQKYNNKVQDAIYNNYPAVFHKFYLVHSWILCFKCNAGKG